MIAVAIVNAVVGAAVGAAAEAVVGAVVAFEYNDTGLSRSMVECAGKVGPEGQQTVEAGYKHVYMSNS